MAEAEHAAKEAMGAVGGTTILTRARNRGAELRTA
jgi:predicted sugar kinase